MSFPTPPSPHPAIGAGTWAWGNQFLWGYSSDQDATLAAGFRRAVERGIHFFDTADSYGTGRWQGRSEQLLGQFAAALPPAQRQPLTLATKLAPFPWRLGRRGYDRAFAASRERLGGRLDRVQLHWSTARYAPWQELPLIDGLADLVQRGAVAELGVSNVGPRRLRLLHQHLQQRGVPLRSLQVQGSLLAPEVFAPGGLAAVARELQIDLIAYSPLALGLLCQQPGALPSRCPAGPRGLLFRRLWPRCQPLLQAMADLAVTHRSTSTAVALNWLRAHGALPIPGIRSPQQADAAADALSWSLSAAHRDQLDGVVLAAGAARMPANPFQSA